MGGFWGQNQVAPHFYDPESEPLSQRILFAVSIRSLRGRFSKGLGGEEVLS